jgi:predicted dehydrogenase
MTDTPINAAIVGAGYIAQYHVDAARAVPGVTVRAVCDLKRQRAEQFAAAAGIDAVYSDVGKLLESEEIDVVHVLTPPHLHVGPVQQALRAGVDVLVEKPMAHSVEACRELGRLAKANGCAFGTSHNFLYFDAYERLVSDLRQGRLGRIDQVDIVWNKELGQLSGGPFGAWMLKDPRNILFEVAPHSFAHCQHLGSASFAGGRSWGGQAPRASESGSPSSTDTLSTTSTFGVASPRPPWTSNEAPTSFTSTRRISSM